MYNWDLENCPLYGVVRCLLFRGCLSTKVNGRIVETFRIVRYIVGVPAFQGCPLSGVPLYSIVAVEAIMTSLFSNFVCVCVCVCGERKVLRF